jgi:signal transduction histidine kinase
MSGNFLGRGIVGGMLFEMPRHASDLAQRAGQVLSGVRAADLVPIRTPNTLAFDSRALKRFGLDEARLPTGATVLNRELSLWQTYRTTILAVLALVFGQLVLISALLFQRHQRRRAERGIRDLSGRLLSAQEDERRRIGRELHDNVSQQVALLAIRIDQVAMKPTESPSTVAYSMRELRQRAVDISTEIHNLSHQLHSPKLEMLGLVDAVRGQCQELLVQGVRANVHDENVPRSLPYDVELCVFRIVQEGLNNVVKHSGSREAAVTLYATGDMLVVTVADPGRGFDQSAAAMHDGVGLASMRERLRLINGELTVRSQPGQGTTITARVPIDRNHTAAADIAGVA